MTELYDQMPHAIRMRKDLGGNEKVVYAFAQSWLKVTGRVPSVRVTAERCGLCRTTANRAILMLKKRSLWVSHKPGQSPQVGVTETGTAVSQKPGQQCPEKCDEIVPESRTEEEQEPLEEQGRTNARDPEPDSRWSGARLRRQFGDTCHAAASWRPELPGKATEVSARLAKEYPPDILSAELAAFARFVGTEVKIDQWIWNNFARGCGTWRYRKPKGARGPVRAAPASAFEESDLDEVFGRKAVAQ